MCGLVQYSQLLQNDHEETEYYTIYHYSTYLYFPAELDRAYRTRDNTTDHFRSLP